MEGINDKSIKHSTDILLDEHRQETYELDDIVYRECFDLKTGERLVGNITMFGGVPVCTVYSDGNILLKMPVDWVNNHRTMMQLIADLHRLDEFLSMFVKGYQ